MEVEIEKNSVKIITIMYFINAVIEVLAETFSFKMVILITKPLIPLLLIILYHFTSLKRDKLFYVVLFLSLLTNLFYIPDSKEFLFYALIAYSLHRILLLILIFKMVSIKNYIPFFLSTLPLGFIFFFLVTSSDIPANSYYLIIFQSVMAAVLGGIAIACYSINDSKENSLLLISILLFLALQLVVYIEKYFLKDSHSIFLRPLAMTLNVCAFYIFYKFVIAAEKIKQ
ncbi:MAG: hypothetical protein ACOVMG_00605 [Flavobacterium sp.]